MSNNSASTLWAAYQQYAHDFKGDNWVGWSKEHTELPVLAVALYMVVVFYAPDYMRKPLRLKALFGVWNLLLSAFSIVGVVHVVPTLANAVMTRGFTATVCKNPGWYVDGPVGLWTALFIYSKFPELLDTFFLVFQKKRVIYLHWYHHISVLLYCWHAFVTMIPAGIWFVSMNYTVHSIMYFYYFAMTAGLGKLMRPIAPLITVLQLSQMVMGSFVAAYTGYYLYFGAAGDCDVDPANTKMALMMYVSYFALFAILFYNKYLAPKPARGGGKGAAAVAAAEESETTASQCTSGDSAGFFHGKDEGKTPAAVAAPAAAGGGNVRRRKNKGRK